MYAKEHAPTIRQDLQQLVVTEFEMGVGASLLDCLRIAQTKKEFMKYKTQLRQLLRSFFATKFDRIPSFTLISVIKVYDLESFPTQVDYVFFYQEEENGHGTF